MLKYVTACFKNTVKCFRHAATFASHDIHKTCESMFKTFGCIIYCVTVCLNHRILQNMQSHVMIYSPIFGVQTHTWISESATVADDSKKNNSV